MSGHRTIRLFAWLVGRPEWGSAMLAEIEQIPDPLGRRRFAAGCLRALAVSVPALVGACSVAGLLSVGVVATALIRYPGLVTGVGTWLEVGFFVAVVVGYVACAAGLASRSVPSMSTRGVLAAGATMAGSWMVVGLSASVALGGFAMALMVVAPTLALGLGWRATRRSFSPWVGLHSVGLASVVAGFTLFLLWAGQTVIFDGRPYDAGLLRDFRASGAPDLATYAVSDSLGSGMVLLLLVPLVSVAAGATGAVMAHRWPRRAHPRA